MKSLHAELCSPPQPHACACVAMEVPSFGSPTASLRIACVGNSITRGDARQEPGEGTHTPHKYKTHNRGNFPAELATLLAGRAAVANFGHGGCSVLNTTRMGCQNFDEWRHALAWKPTVVLLMAGTNDSKESLWNSHEFIRAYHRMALQLLALPSRPALLVMAPPPLIASKSPWRPDFLRSEVVPRIVSAVGSIQRRLRQSEHPMDCRPGSVHFLNLHDDAAYAACRETPATDDCSRLYVDDGVHTSAEGARAIASAVFARLRNCSGSAVRRRRLIG